MKDIIPYTSEQADRLGEALVKLGAATPSPQALAELVRHISTIHSLVVVLKGANPDVKTLLNGYTSRVNDIIHVVLIMQASCISEMEKLVQESFISEMGELNRGKRRDNSV
jgi:hypothetical protein